MTEMPKIGGALAPLAGGRDVTRYDPDQGLKDIAVAEAAERHAARAKDRTKLFEAIEVKIDAEADYIVWRDSVVPKGRPKKDCSSEIVLPDADPGDLIAHRWRKRFCTKMDRRTVRDPAKIDRALEDAQHRCARICEQEKQGTIRGTEGTGEFERYTPEKYIEAARTVLGTIDLDPATGEIAQRTVKADRYFTVDDDGLAKEWHGNVWLNPPYHRELAPKFIDKLIAERAAGRVKQAIMLTNNCTDTEWFLRAAQACDAVCFTCGRIKFTTPSGEEVLPTQGQAFFYFGDDVAGFERGFAHIGFGMVGKWAYTREESETDDDQE